jgi:hypothetical protein
MHEGIYRVYRKYVAEDGRSQSRLVGRFVFYGDRLVSLEDHDGLVESLAPNGKVTEKTLRRLGNLSESPYWDLVLEDDVQAGEHEDLLPEVDVGPAAWPKPEGE